MIEICSILQTYISYKLTTIMSVSNDQFHCMFKNLVFDVKYAIITTFDW